jgi:transposase
MKKELPLARPEGIALARFALLNQIQDLLSRQWPLAAALDQVATSHLTLPDGQQKPVARRTLEDWWYAYQHEGFAALQPKTRSDRGAYRRVSMTQKQWVLAQAQAHLAVPITVLCRQWRQQDPQLPSLSTLYRLLRQNELQAKARRRQLDQPLGGPTKAFEAPCVNDLWMVDFSPGPFLHPPGGKPQPTFLCLLLDDHSRLVPYAAY